MEESVDFTKLKYVLYARKSTTDESRQVRSIEDQIKDCQERVIIPLKLNIVKTFQETKSAKTPNQRPIFNQIISDIKKGKYDGIVAWNPDRLARNMLEGGEIIDMIDNGIIKDLKFVTHHFTKDANGKMLLGMAFVLSKQYSDDLSQKVSRGVRRNFEEGKSGIPKHGYIRKEDGTYAPDGRNFELICEAWEMRKENYTYDDIVKHLNENNYYRETKSGKRVNANKHTLTRIFSNPFYYGMLYSEKNDAYTDLREAYNFQPAVSEKDYFVIQRLSNRKPMPKDNKTFYPFRQFILCLHCNKYMYVAPSTGSKKYLYARCDKDCSRKKKSIRVKVVLEFLYAFLSEGLSFTEKEYREYQKKMKSISQEKRVLIKTKLHNIHGQLKQINHEIEERSLKIVKYDQNNPIYKSNEKKIMALQRESDTLQKSVNEIKKQIRNPADEEVTIEEFLNYSKEAAIRMKAANPITKDRIARKIFLNLTVDEEKVVSYQLKDPFKTLLKTRKISPGRGGET